MQEAMEADQDKPLSSSGSFYVAEDSFLLSDYLHRQAEKAGNRFFNNTNSLIFLRSRLLLSELEQKEEEENSDRCCPPELNPMPLGLSAAHKESSESFTGRECSSRILSELEQEKGNSSLPHIIPASSVSYAESSECCESIEAAKAATRIEANSESLHNNMLCHESRQAISLSIDEEEEEDADDDEDATVEEVLTASLDNIEALNLLVTAAMQVGKDDACDRVVGQGSLKMSNSPSEGEHNASAVHVNSPILKRKVIRRAKSAFQKQNCDDQVHRLELSEAATRVFEKKAKHAVGTHMVDLAAAQVSRKGFVARTKRRKLRDLSLDPSNTVAAACTDVDEDLERNQGEGKKWPIGSFGDVKEEISEVENMQVLPATLPSSLSTEASKIAHRQDGNHGYFVDHRKLQVSSARLSDACNAERSKGSQMQNGQPRLPLKLENSQTPTSSKNGLTSKGVTRACTAREEMRKRLESQEEACLGITQLDDTMKSESSVLRLKILPIRLPSADLPLFKEVSKSESTEVILEDRMVTRKRRSLSSGEHDKVMVAAELMLPKEAPMPDIKVKDGDPVIRSKRGRFQALPTKFSDSVLQPWKTSRKRCK